ncbi:MAG TPA: YbhB/YbcL family Raf kinase inhibitor-like protein [Candidatus Acidoferrales bacterium]|jgi:Raf kinase inhibitor-like YbhB/YbcL family protein|nr:YbhB/YbcL family Raf kinase inhibitor-like protein [Candidatus Acidoferrales bacterium]
MTARINLPWVAILFTSLLCSSCSNDVQPSAKGDVTKINVTSTAFEDGQPIPEKYTGQGDNVSPPLQWSDAPQQTKSFALICEDPDAPSGTFTHWLVYNLPPTTISLDENVPKGQSMVYGFLQGKSDFGNVGYGGPAPPAGKVHHYIFKVYAVDIVLLLQGGGDRSDLVSAMNSHIIGEGELTGTFETSN